MAKLLKQVIQGKKLSMARNGPIMVQTAKATLTLSGVEPRPSAPDVIRNIRLPQKAITQICRTRGKLSAFCVRTEGTMLVFHHYFMST